MNRTDPFHAYKLYLALKLHFTTDKYDITQSKGRLKASRAAFQKRPLYGLHKIAAKYGETDLINYLVANFVAGDKYGGIFNPSSQDVYDAWLGRQERLGYLFEMDLHSLVDRHSPERLSELWDTDQGHPVILRAVLGQHVHLETLVLLNKQCKFREALDVELLGDPVWAEVSRLIGKYNPFVRLAKDRIASIITQVFGAELEHEQQAEAIRR